MTALDDCQRSPASRRRQARAATEGSVLGAGGQLGRALRETYFGATHVEFAERADVDLTSSNLGSARRWRDYDAIVNAAAYTAVDTAETPDGCAVAWATNVTGVAALARIATSNGITLVHVSSDYVFDGTAENPYREDDPVAPLGVYGLTKAAGDQVGRQYRSITSCVRRG